MSEPIKLVLDSGAFTAWLTGQPIKVEDYIEFAKRFKPYLWRIINLDVLPGDKGKIDRSSAAVERSARASYDNQQIIKAAGLAPMPVFHQGEGWRWLDRMLDDKEPIIGISPYLRAAKHDIMAWLDQVFDRITDQHGRPIIQTHGFGVMTSEIVSGYPWYSVDASTWARQTGMGLLPFPLFKNGKPDFKRICRVHISERYKTVYSRPSFDQLGPLVQKQLVDWLHSIGTSLPRARNLSRDRLYIGAYVCSHYGDAWRWQWGQRPYLHSEKRKDARAIKPWDRVKIVFATTPQSKQHNMVLNRLKLQHRLVSYWKMRDITDDYIPHYYATGMPPSDRNTSPRNVNWNSARYRSFRTRSIIERNERNEENGITRKA